MCLLEAEFPMGHQVGAGGSCSVWCREGTRRSCFRREGREMSGRDSCSGHLLFSPVSQVLHTSHLTSPFPR